MTVHPSIAAAGALGITAIEADELARSLYDGRGVLEERDRRAVAADVGTLAAARRAATLAIVAELRRALPPAPIPTAPGSSCRACGTRDVDCERDRAELGAPCCPECTHRPT